MKKSEKFRKVHLVWLVQLITSAYAVEPLRTRLVGGSGLFEGRVEVYYQGVWGTVCDDGFDLNDAHVVCHTLGYPRASAFNRSASFGEGTDAIILDNLECTGSESNIAFCPHNGYYNHNCGHQDDVGVICDGIVTSRLVDGSTNREGRVEVYYRGSYGTVCHDSFGITDADVVCRMLGYTFAESYSCCAAFGEGSGEIFVDNLYCTGEEVTIGHCNQNPFGTHNCRHNEDVGVTCIALPVRLVDGDTPNEGRVEVKHPDRYSWGTICDDSWDINEATVICRMLGYPAVSSVTKRFGSGSGDIILDNVECDGSESHIAQCNHAEYLNHNCDHSQDVGVVCSGEAELRVRLVDGPDESQGRVELFYFGSWGTVCQYGWTLLDSHVVCKMLGFVGALAHSSYSSYGRGTGESLLEYPGCTGREQSLLDCDLPYGIGFTYFCPHTRDIGVSCLKWDDLEVRLVDGSSVKEGRVEILYSGTWGTVCDDKWGLNDSHVVCRMLGYARAESYTCCAGFGPGSGPILLEDVECDGTEGNIGHCLRGDYETHNCDHSEDVGVSCIEHEVNEETSTTMTMRTTSLSTDDIKMGLSQSATYGLFGFLTILVIVFLLASIIMAFMMQKYRHAAMRRQTPNPNCYDGPGGEGTVQLDKLPGSRIQEGSSPNQSVLYETLQHPDKEGSAYENIHKQDK